MSYLPNHNGGYSAFKEKKTIELFPDFALEKDIFDKSNNKVTITTELIALSEQYLQVLDKLSKYKVEDMSDPLYRSLVISKIQLLIRIHKLLPNKTEDEIAKFLSEVREYNFNAYIGSPYQCKKEKNRF